MAKIPLKLIVYNSKSHRNEIVLQLSLAPINAGQPLLLGQRVPEHDLPKAVTSKPSHLNIIN
jgi:hypothetical protein